MKVVDFKKQEKPGVDDFIVYLKTSLAEAEDKDTGKFTTFVLAGLSENGSIICLGNANIIESVFLAESLKQHNLNEMQEWE
jgi:hypothetical protein